MRRSLKCLGAAILALSASSVGVAGVTTHPAGAVAGPFTVSTALSAHVPANTIPVVGDFTNDGVDDILWYGFGAITDRRWTGQANGVFVGSTIVIGGDYEPLTGDFNNDGNLDIFWYQAGPKPDYLWYGTGHFTFTSVAVPVNGTYRALIADYDGDGFTDILWYAPGGAPDSIFYGRHGGFTSVSLSINGDYDYVTGGDFEGAGALDLLWWKVGSSTHPVWRYHGGRGTASYTASNIVGPGVGSLPMVMKINGDAVDDILWYGDGSAADAVAFGPTFSRTATTINGHYQPLWGNFDGDNNLYDDVFWWGSNPGATDAFWAGNGTANFTDVSMAGTPHYDWDTHAPLLGFFDSIESLDLGFQDSKPGGANAFFYGNDVDGVNPNPHARPFSSVRGRVCGPVTVPALRLRCRIGD